MHAQVKQSEGKSVISLAGRFDFNAHRAFRDAYEGQLGDPGVREVEVELGSVDYLDSSALGMLLLLREKAQAANKTVALRNCRGTVKQVLDIANFGRLFAIR
jgi:anti-anti-sigma factor